MNEPSSKRSNTIRVIEIIALLWIAGCCFPSMVISVLAHMFPQQPKPPSDGMRNPTSNSEEMIAMADAEGSGPGVLAAPQPAATPWPTPTPWPSPIPLPSPTPWPSPTPIPSSTPEPTAEPSPDLSDSLGPDKDPMDSFYHDLSLAMKQDAEARAAATRSAYTEGLLRDPQLSLPSGFKHQYVPREKEQSANGMAQRWFIRVEFGLTETQLKNNMRHAIHSCIAETNTNYVVIVCWLGNSDKSVKLGEARYMPKNNSQLYANNLLVFDLAPVRKDSIAYAAYHDPLNAAPYDALVLPRNAIIATRQDFASSNKDEYWSFQQYVMPKRRHHYPDEWFKRLGSRDFVHVQMGEMLYLEKDADSDLGLISISKKGDSRVYWTAQDIDKKPHK